MDPAVNKLEARKSVGIVFQHPSLDDDMTGIENLDLHQVLCDIPRP
jgi:ABC-2 type transport system ATP-binding protein